MYTYTRIGIRTGWGWGLTCTCFEYTRLHSVFKPFQCHKGGFNFSDFTDFYLVNPLPPTPAPFGCLPLRNDYIYM